MESQGRPSPKGTFFSAQFFVRLALDWKVYLGILLHLSSLDQIPPFDFSRLHQCTPVKEAPALPRQGPLDRDSRLPLTPSLTTKTR